MYYVKRGGIFKPCTGLYTTQTEVNINERSWRCWPFYFVFAYWSLIYHFIWIKTTSVIQLIFKCTNHIGGVIIIVFLSIGVDRGFEPGLVNKKSYQVEWGHTGVRYNFYELQLCYYLHLLTTQYKTIYESCKQENVTIMLILKVVPNLNLF